jgi:hypothetical protein
MVVVLAWFLLALSMVACDRLPQLPQLQAPGTAGSAAPSPSPQATAAAPPQATRPAARAPAGPNPPQFAGGFNDFHEMARELIGEPVHNEYSPWPGMSVQQTTNGTLIWVQDHDLVFVAEDGRTFTWDPNTRSLKIFPPT